MPQSEQKTQTGNQIRRRPDLASGDPANANYKVGYGRPPVHTRFKPGRSGNPSGRPAGRPSARAMVERALHRKIPIRLGEKTSMMPMFQAMLHAQLAKGAKGDARSASFAGSMADKVGLLRDQEDETAKPGGGAASIRREHLRPSSELFAHVDLGLLTEDEQVELSRLAEIIDLGGGMTALNVNDFGRAREIVNKGRGKDITPPGE
jgi:hypothetical protein